MNPGKSYSQFGCFPAITPLSGIAINAAAPWTQEAIFISFHIVTRIKIYRTMRFINKLVRQLKLSNNYYNT